MFKTLFVLWFFALLVTFVSTVRVSLAAPGYLNPDHIYTTPGNGQNSSLIYQIAEQNIADPNVILNPTFTQPITAASGFFAGISQAISNGLNQSFNGYLPGAIAALSNVVKSFFLNPNLVQIAANSNNHSDLSFWLTQLANIIYGIAFDLLFLLFILAIWQYWTKASWQGNISAMSAIGRLICTIGIVIAWPTIYSFEIELSNEMISAIFANGADQLHLFDMVMANMVNVSAYSGLLGTLMISQPVALGIAQFSGFLSTIALLALCILAIVLIYELVYLIALKAMQTALLTAQYVFAPVFLIFFATPSTEKIATGYIRTFVEVSVWSFIWIGLLKILVILMYASFNPWGKIITAIGILQLMMRVPQFLGRFKVSPASAFVNPAFLTDGLQKNALTYARQIAGYKNQFVSAFTGMFREAGAGQTFNSGSNKMSADFSFGNAGGNISPLPGSDRYKSTDSRQEKNLPPYTNNAPSPIIDKQPNSAPPVGKNIETETSANRHNAFSIPVRRNLPRQRDIFARHNKTGAATGDKVANLPPEKSTPRVMPVAAAALLSNHFSKLDLSPDRLNLTADKSSLSSNRLLATRLAAAQLTYGSGSVLANRQQFVLPSFTRLTQTGSKSDIGLVQSKKTNSHRPEDDAGNKNKSDQSRKSDFNDNRGYLLAEDSAGSRSKLLSNDRQFKPSSHHVNQNKTAHYYSSSVYPGWQRPYYRDSRIGLPVNAESRSAFYAGINYPAAPRFRSYYS